MKASTLYIFLLTATVCYGTNTPDKPLVIITQDGEVDDRSSFMRFLLYSADMDLRGIIATNSKWQKNGHGLQWIHDAYDLYSQVRQNLLLHNPDYPTVEYLKSITVKGNENPAHLAGAPPYEDSEGADLIIREILGLNDELLHINCWGGVNTVAHALWKLRENYPQAYKEKAGQIRVMAIDFQDEAGDWIASHLPEIRIIRCNSFHMTWNYHSPEKPLPHNPYPNLMSEKWLNEHIKVAHGPLGAWYPQDNISEGDTPAFLNLIDNGLNAYENYALGGWGGRYVSFKGNYWRDAADDNNPHKSLWRWLPDVQNDFAARTDWCTKSFEEANHPPEIEEVSFPETAKPGQHIALHAMASDPDADHVFYYWWHYPEPSGMGQPVLIRNETSKDASLIVPDEPGSSLHIILEVSDEGVPSLKRYRRVIVKIEE